MTDEHRIVIVAGERERPAPRGAGELADILNAIRALPDQVAERVVGGGDDTDDEGAPSEVTFAPEEPPVPVAEDPSPEDESVEPEPTPVSRGRSGFRFPGAPKRRVEVMD